MTVVVVVARVASMDAMRRSHAADDAGMATSPASQRCTVRTLRPATSRAKRETESPDAAMRARSSAGVTGWRRLATAWTAAP